MSTHTWGVVKAVKKASFIYVLCLFSLRQYFFLFIPRYFTTQYILKLIFCLCSGV